MANETAAGGGGGGGGGGGDGGGSLEFHCIEIYFIFFPEIFSFLGRSLGLNNLGLHVLEKAH